MTDDDQTHALISAVEHALATEIQLLSNRVTSLSELHAALRIDLRSIDLSPLHAQLGNLELRLTRLESQLPQPQPPPPHTTRTTAESPPEPDPSELPFGILPAPGTSAPRSSDT